MFCFFSLLEVCESQSAKATLKGKVQHRSVYQEHREWPFIYVESSDLLESVCSPQRHDKCPWISLPQRRYVRGSAEMMMPPMCTPITQCTSAGTVESKSPRQVIILLRAPGKARQCGIILALPCCLVQSRL